MADKMTIDSPNAGTFEKVLHEESLQERENALAAREQRLLAQEALAMAALERMARKMAPASEGEDECEEEVAVTRPIEFDENGKPIPYLDKDMPHGVVYGDPAIQFVQNGHRFAGDGKYLGDEPRGTGKPFNPKLLGVIKSTTPAAPSGASNE